MKIRSFVAIEFPSTIQDAIIWQTTILRKNYPNPVIRWVKPENIHLTLKFLGDLAKSDLDVLARSLTDEAKRVEPFSISFTNLGIFPNSKKPRIIWIGVNSPAILMEFQSKIESLTSRHGIHIEQRPFSPHITLGRISERNSLLNIDNLILDISSIKVSTIDNVNISSIKIFKSDLKPDGPIYTVISNIPFSKFNN
jgi:2'-5' RNA ligase